MNDFIILKEAEFLEQEISEEPAQIEPLDEAEVTDLAMECEIYGQVLVENKYVDAVCGALEDCGYPTTQIPYSGIYTYIKI